MELRYNTYRISELSKYFLPAKRKLQFQCNIPLEFSREYLPVLVVKYLLSLSYENTSLVTEFKLSISGFCVSSSLFYSMLGDVLSTKGEWLNY